MPYFRIKIVMENFANGEKITEGPHAPFTTYYKNRGVPLKHAIHTQDFTSLKAKPTIFAHKAYADGKKIEIDRTLERIQESLRKEGIDRRFTTEVV